MFENIDKCGLGDFGYRIFLDRYAMKDLSGNVKEEQIVLAKVKGQKEIGKVVSVGSEVLVQFDGMKLAFPAEQLDVPIELSPRDMWERLAKAMAVKEQPYDGDEATKCRNEFMWLFDNWKFVPGGRILAGMGSSTERTFYNCFVIPSPKDSKVGIFESANLLSQIMSRGGGVGINISTLRPRYSRTFKTDGRSSGAISWGELYSFVTGLIEIGGSRRGALMLVLDDWHPDIEEFITVKQDMSRVLNANISIGISDKFVQEVVDDGNWNLIFPDTSHPDYDEDWDGDIDKWLQEKGANCYVVHKTVKARDLWNSIVTSAWKCAEPGLWFRDRAEACSNSHYYDKLVCVNPCAEEPLPAYGTCNLGSINLAADEFYSEENGHLIFDKTKFSKVVRLAVRFLDNVIDMTPHFMDEFEQQQHKERRIGLGTMGLADFLLKMGCAYGSDESLVLVDDLYKTLAFAAYEASIELAKERGPFPKCDNKFLESEYMKQLIQAYPKLEDFIKDYGIRNVTLLTQAPTGTTGTMVGVSTGIEPYYSWKYTRNSRLGSYTEYAKGFLDYCKEKSIEPSDEALNAFIKVVPAAVTAQDLTPEEHVSMQAAIQKWIDSSISKTCNVPNHYTVEQVGELYQLMYDLGCKGGTIYRDGSRDKQVLELKSSTPSDAPGAPQRTLLWRTRPTTLSGETHRLETPVGAAYLTLNSDDNGLFEVFVSAGKVGSAVTADAEGFGRLISLILRMPDGLAVDERIKAIVKQLGNIGSDRSFGFGPNRVSSLPDAIAKVLSEEYQLKEAELPALPESVTGDLCPGCGQATLIRIEGCRKCYSCGHAEC